MPPQFDPETIRFVQMLQQAQQSQGPLGPGPLQAPQPIAASPTPEPLPPMPRPPRSGMLQGYPDLARRAGTDVSGAMSDLPGRIAGLPQTIAGAFGYHQKPFQQPPLSDTSPRRGLSAGTPSYLDKGIEKVTAEKAKPKSKRDTSQDRVKPAAKSEWEVVREDRGGQLLRKEGDDQLYYWSASDDSDPMPVPGIKAAPKGTPFKLDASTMVDSFEPSMSIAGPSSPSEITMMQEGPPQLSMRGPESPAQITTIQEGGPPERPASPYASGEFVGPPMGETLMPVRLASGETVMGRMIDPSQIQEIPVQQPTPPLQGYSPELMAAQSSLSPQEKAMELRAQAVGMDPAAQRDFYNTKLNPYGSQYAGQVDAELAMLRDQPPDPQMIAATAALAEKVREEEKKNTVAEVQSLIQER